MFKTRLNRLRQFMDENGLDSFLISDLSNIRYLSNFSGSSALLVVRKDSAHFFTDFRYEEQSHNEIPSDLFEIHTKNPDIYAEAVKLLKSTGGSVGFERNSVTYNVFLFLRRNLQSLSLKSVGDIVRSMRSIKVKNEISKIQKAQAIAEDVLSEVIKMIRPGRTTELEVAAEIEYRLKLKGASGPSFPTIVASGPHSALPHARPRNAVIIPNAPLIIDMGCYFEGYASDMTRTFWVGDKPDEKFVEIYNIVNEARNRAIGAIKPGVSSVKVDSAARDYIKNKGYGENFGHGLGHGVGLEVHEKPRVSFQSKDVLISGNVITIEPGIYLPGYGGVRIEDMVVVGEVVRNLTNFPHSLITIG